MNLPAGGSDLNVNTFLVSIVGALVVLVTHHFLGRSARQVAFAYEPSSMICMSAQRADRARLRPPSKGGTGNGPRCWPEVLAFKGSATVSGRERKCY
jgi:hypothetical protein